MFRESPTEIDKIFSSNIDSDFTLDQWKEKLHLFLPLFGREINEMLEICQKEPLASILTFSKLEDVIWLPNGILIAEFRIRPKNNYYDELLKPVPQPDNHQGPINTGIELTVGIYRGTNRDKLIHPPHVTITFKIWGPDERGAFIAFYRDFRRPVEKLLTGLDLDLFTPCCFKNLEKYKGS
jgi:hypothetical protein